MADIEFHRNITAWQLQAAEARIAHRLFSQPRGSLGEAHQLRQRLASLLGRVDAYCEVTRSGGKYPIERMRDEVGPELSALGFHIATSYGVHFEDGYRAWLEKIIEPQTLI